MRMMALGLCLTGTAALAGPYDGLYRPDHAAGADWDCQSVGMDGGAIAVRGGVFHGVENSCELTNPVQVRGMAATLYDAVCSSEGEAYSYRMMLMATDTGIIAITDGDAAPMRRCP